MKLYQNVEGLQWVPTLFPASKLYCKLWFCYVQKFRAFLVCMSSTNISYGVVTATTKKFFCLTPKLKKYSGTTHPLAFCWRSTLNTEFLFLEAKSCVESLWFSLLKPPFLVQFSPLFRSSGRLPGSPGHGEMAGMAPRNAEPNRIHDIHLPWDFDGRSWKNFGGSAIFLSVWILHLFSGKFHNFG